MNDSNLAFLRSKDLWNVRNEKKNRFGDCNVKITKNESANSASEDFSSPNNNLGLELQQNYFFARVDHPLELEEEQTIEGGEF